MSHTTRPSHTASDHTQQPHTADGGHYVVGGSAVPTSAAPRKRTALPIDVALPDEDHPTDRLTAEMEEDSIRALVAWVMCLVGCSAALGFVIGFSFEKLAG